jgi:hypothetical protein
VTRLNVNLCDFSLSILLLIYPPRDIITVKAIALSNVQTFYTLRLIFTPLELSQKPKTMSDWTTPSRARPASPAPPALITDAFSVIPISDDGKISADKHIVRSPNKPDNQCPL